MRYIFFLVLTFYLFHLNAQDLSQTIRGQVVDNETEVSLPGANILLQIGQETRGTSTDVDGNFELKNVPVGRHNLKVSFLGYQEVILPNILVGSAKEVVLKVALEESYTKLEEVEIIAENPKENANNEMATVSARSFSVDETSRFAASVDDPARMAQSFAGVSTSDDISNEIVIRGNSPLGLLWRMNGIEIPSPNHFSEAGASSGGISALSINMLDNSDFLTGAFPAEYGNATSGVFDVKLRNGNNQKREYAFQIGVLGTDIALEGPFQEGYQGSYLINYRYSTLSVLSGLGIIDTDGNDNLFQDLSFQFNMPTEKFGVFKVFGLFGWSSSISETNAELIKEEPEEEYYDDEFISNLGVLGISNQYFLSNKAYIKTIASYSNQTIGYVEEFYNNSTLEKELDYEDEFVNEAVRFNVFLNQKFNTRHTIRTGVVISQLRYNMYGEGFDDEDIFRTFLNDNGSAQQYQAYGQWKYRFHENWTLNTGLHYMKFSLNGKQSVEPRLGLAFKIDEIQKLSFGFGLHSRLAPLSIYTTTTVDEYGVEAQGNKDLEISKAQHYVIGYDRQLGEELRMKVEAYYQYLTDVYVVDDPNTSYSAVNASTGYNTRILSDEGTATNMGIELTLEKFFSSNYYYLFTASLFDSKYKMPDGREFDTRFNTNYIFSILGGKEYKMGKEDKNLLGVNLKVLWSGGNRYRPVDVNQSILNDETAFVEDVGFSGSAPDYYRLDATVSYRINKPKMAHIISLQIQNVTNRYNVFNYYYDTKEQEVLSNDQFGIIPILKYRIEF